MRPSSSSDARVPVAQSRGAAKAAMKRGRMLVRALCCATVLVAGNGAGAQEIDARLSTSLYALERIPGCRGESGHLRALQTIALDVRRLSGARLSLHAEASYANDLRAALKDDPRVWLSTAYLRWDAPGGVVRIGRQAVWAGVGSGQVDGVRYRRSLAAGLAVDVYAGRWGRLDLRGGQDDWRSSHMLGGQVTWQRRRDTRLDLSVVSQRRPGASPSAPGLYTGDYWLTHEPAGRERRRLGFSAWRALGRGFAGSASADYDLLRERLVRVAGAARWQHGRWQAAAEGALRRAALDTGSIFALVDAQECRELSARLQYGLSRDCGMSVRATRVLYEGDDAARVACGFHCAGGSCTVTYGAGTHHDRWMLVAGYHREVARRLGLRTSVSWGRFALQDAAPADAGTPGAPAVSAAEEWQTSLSGILGAEYAAARTVQISTELQALRNPHADSDLRAMVRVSYRLRRAAAATPEGSGR